MSNDLVQRNFLEDQCPQDLLLLDGQVLLDAVADRRHHLRLERAPLRVRQTVFIADRRGDDSVPSRIRSRATGAQRSRRAAVSAVLTANAYAHVVNWLSPRNVVAGAAGWPSTPPARSPPPAAEYARFEMADVVQRPLQRKERGAEQIRPEVGECGGLLVAGAIERNDPFRRCFAGRSPIPV